MACDLYKTCINEYCFPGEKIGRYRIHNTMPVATSLGGSKIEIEMQVEEQSKDGNKKLTISRNLFT